MLLTTTNNNLFDTFFSDPWFNDPWFDDRDVQKAQKKLYGHNGKRMMLTDIKESDKGYELEMDLPGFKKDEIKASLENGYLTITAEKGLEKDQKEEEGKKYICRERYSGSCQRTFYVGDEIEQDDIKASFKHGILRWIFQRSSLNHRLRKRNVSPSRDNQILQMISGLPVQSAYTIWCNVYCLIMMINCYR